jgi:amidase
LGPEARVHSLKEVIEFNKKHAERVMPYFGQERMTAAQRKPSLAAKKYREARARCRRLTRKEGIDAIIKEKKLDAVTVISGGPAWVIDLANGDAINWDMESTSPPAVAGYPHITVPAGYLFGLPIGISFFGKAWSEAKLLEIAYAFEQARSARRPPEFLKTADLGL